MHRKDSKNFVHVQVSMLNDLDGEQDFRHKSVLAIPVSMAEKFIESGIIEYNERWNPPFVMDPKFDDVALAIPGSFVIRN